MSLKLSCSCGNYRACILTDFDILKKKRKSDLLSSKWFNSDPFLFIEIKAFCLF